MFAQNVETVRRLTHPVRDPRAGDLFAWLGGQVDTYAHPIAGQWIDIGSPEALERARRSDSAWDPGV